MKEISDMLLKDFTEHYQIILHEGHGDGASRLTNKLST